MKDYMIHSICTALLLFCIININLNSYIDTPKLTPTNALGLSLTSSDLYLNEDHFALMMDTIVNPYLDTISHNGYLKAMDGIKLHYIYYLTPIPKGSIIISHGFSETAEKYKELIYYCLQAHYNVFFIEHRGHGFSDHTPLGQIVVDVKDFDYYVSDFRQFMTQVVLPNNQDLPLHLYGHSMGGAIALNFLEEYPNLFHSAVLSSPMLEINTQSFPLFISHFLGNTPSILAQATCLFVSPHSPSESPSGSLARCHYYMHTNTHYFPLHSLGFSPRWIKSALLTVQKINTPDAYKKLTMPLLIFEAQQDSLVANQPLACLLEYAPCATLVSLPSAKHELYNMSDKYLFPYLDALFNFYNQY